MAPNGTVLEEVDEFYEGWLLAQIDPSKADEKSFSQWNDIMADRRPESYEL